MENVKMKLITHILLLSLFVNYCFGNCDIGEYEQFINNNDPVNDDTTEPFLIIETQNIVSIIGRADNPTNPLMVISYADNQLTFAPTSLFPNEAETSTIGEAGWTVSAGVLLECENGATYDVWLHQEVIDVNNNDPTFSVGQYTFSLPMPFTPFIDLGSFGDQIKATDIDATNNWITFTISGDDFIFVYNGETEDDLEKVHVPQLQAKRPLRLTKTEEYTITATDAGNPSRSTEATVIISVDDEYSFPLSPTFSEAYHIADYTVDENDDHSFHAEIPLYDGGGAPEVTLEGEYAGHFQKLYTDGTISINLDNSLPEDVLATETYIFLTVRAEIPNAEVVAKTALIIKLPAEPPPLAEISFEQDLYTYVVQPEHVVDETVSATSSIAEDITYTISETNIPAQLTLTANGRLYFSNLPSGSYRLTLIAQGAISKVKATAPLMVSVGTQICGGEPIVPYFLQVKNVLEGESTVLLPKVTSNEVANYFYHIDSIIPDTGNICVNTEGDVVTLALDREAEEFTSSRPQYTVVVRQSEDTTPDANLCSSSSYSHYGRAGFYGTKTHVRADADQCISLDDIANDLDRVVLAVIVEDVNDNDPVFAKIEKIVGYPKEDVLMSVSPSYLLQVLATDADDGINAELAYNAASNRVDIHASTGIVYPTEELFVDDDDFTFAVTATDQNGAGRVSSNTLTVTVKFLDFEHISVITYQNQYLEDIDQILADLSGYADVRYLTASVLPINDISRTLTRATGENYLVIVAYAFDGNKQLLTTEQLQTLLENVDGLNVSPLPDPDTVIPPTTEEPGSTTPCRVDGDDDEHSHGGFIAAIVVLAILLAIAVVGFLAFYYFKYRKRENYSRMENGVEAKSRPNEDDGLQTPQFVKNKPAVSVSKLDVVDINQRRPTGIVLSSQFSEEPITPSSTMTPQEVFNEGLKERRKSVQFNATVEEIDILRDAENDEKKENGADESKEREVESVRL